MRETLRDVCNSIEVRARENCIAKFQPGVAAGIFSLSFLPRCAVVYSHHRCSPTCRVALLHDYRSSATARLPKIAFATARRCDSSILDVVSPIPHDAKARPACSPLKPLFSRSASSFAFRPTSLYGWDFADHDLAMSPLLFNHERISISPRFSCLSSICRVSDIQPVSSAHAAHHCRGWISSDSGRDMASGVSSRVDLFETPSNK